MATRPKKPRTFGDGQPADFQEDENMQPASIDTMAHESPKRDKPKVCYGFKFHTHLVSHLVRHRRLQRRLNTSFA
jgi:hypothetical protein